MYTGQITLTCKNKLCEKESLHTTYNGEYVGDYVCPYCGFKTLTEFHLTEQDLAAMNNHPRD